MEGARAIWSLVAEGYDRQAAAAFEEGRIVSEWLVEAVGAAPGRTILELATGPGMVAIEAAARGATVIATDLAPGMIEVAQRNASNAGVSGISFRTMDAMEPDLADVSVDGVVCRFGVMLMPDPVVVLSGCRRMLRPDGAVAYAVWGPSDENGWASLIADATVRCGIDVPPPPGPGGMFVLPDAASNERVARAAGFTDVTVAELRPQMRFASFDQYWTLRLEASVSARLLFEPLSDEQIAQIRRTAEDMCASARAPDGSLTFDTLVLAVRAA